MACPICTSPEGTAITEGMLAGDGVLIVTAMFVIGGIARFGYRLWATEETPLKDTRATEGTESRDHARELA